MSRDLTAEAPGSSWGFLNNVVTLEDPISGFSHHINMTFPFFHSAATVYMIQSRQRKEARVAFLQYGDSRRQTDPKIAVKGNVSHLDKWSSNWNAGWGGQGREEQVGGGKWKGQTFLCTQSLSLLCVWSTVTIFLQSSWPGLALCLPWSCWEFNHNVEDWVQVSAQPHTSQET